MPIKRLLEASDLPADEQAVLGAAFDRTLRLLCLIDRGDPFCGIVARKIMEIGAKRALDPVAISEQAVEELLEGRTRGVSSR
jgi:hypothetical protein